MKYKRVIWDWNGTLLDDFDISIDAINEMFEERGMPKFKDKEDYLKHFCFPIEKYYKNVGFDFLKELRDKKKIRDSDMHNNFMINIKINKMVIQDEFNGKEIT